MNADTAARTALVAYSQARSLSYSLEFRALKALAGLAPGGTGTSAPEGKLLERVREGTTQLFEQDVRNIVEGFYPVSVLFPAETPIRHLKRIPSLVVDGVRSHLRRRQGKTTTFSREASDFLSELPRYYRRNFHFQTDGYLSERSAELYDHQVELLFGGTGDPMRRLAIPPMKRRLSAAPLRILEIGTGTGSATRFVRLAFPKARIVATDLSGPYLKVAQRKLSGFDRIDYLQAPGEELPFQEGQFDAVFSVFLFHELPLEARKAVLRESLRVLRPGGLLVAVDSIQSGECPEYEPLLQNFTVDYHEPFYRCYIAHPMPDLIRECGFENVERGTGFVSTVVSALKP
jgi:ubiquinone/menaquinone biosynthesis C-methylase UbiE